MSAFLTKESDSRPNFVILAWNCEPNAGSESLVQARRRKGKVSLSGRVPALSMRANREMASEGVEVWAAPRMTVFHMKRSGRGIRSNSWRA